MLIVRAAQLDALQRHAREAFIGVMRRHLERAFPERCTGLGGERVRALIERGMAAAQGFGLQTEQDVAGLIHFMFESHPEFDQRPDFAWAVQILRDPDLEPGERVDRLFTAWAPRKAARGGG